MMENTKATAIQGRIYDKANMASMEILRVRNALLLDPLSLLTAPMNPQTMQQTSYDPNLTPANYMSKSEPSKRIPSDQLFNPTLMILQHR